MASSIVKKILVCGSGNGGHVLASISASLPNLETRVLTLSPGTAARLSRFCEDNDGIDVSVYKDYSPGRKLKAKPKLITNDPQTAIRDVDIVFLTTTAFAHANYLQNLLPFIEPNTIIVGLPGQAGFELECLHILGRKAKQCVIVSFESLPWTCRIMEFGKHVKITAIKETLLGGILVGNECLLPYSSLDIIQDVLGKKPSIDLTQNYLVVNLIGKSIIHPPLMYGGWKSWNGQPLDQIPLFYQDINELQADLLSRVSNEIINVGNEIAKLRPDIDVSPVIHIFEWYKRNHTRIGDDTTLMMAMRTNKAYNGFLAPMKKVKGGFVPDFSHRYITEDIPYGLVVLKGIAEIVNVPTPSIDEIIQWCQEKLEKEYIVGHELRGKDLHTSRAPQVFGYHTLDDILNVKSK